MSVRKASEKDIGAAAEIYERIHEEEEKGLLSVGWRKNIYPVESDARQAFDRGELFICEDAGRVVGSMIINHRQPEMYEGAPWSFQKSPEQVMVLHTLSVHPDSMGRGYGSEMVKFYEKYAQLNGAGVLRIDTQSKNLQARNFYKKRGFREVCELPCVFNGISDVRLVLLEKQLDLPVKKELWDAYDIDFHLIPGKELIRGEAIPDGQFHLVTDILLKHEDGSFLITKRSPEKTFAGMWEASSCGSALKGEDAETAARRELYEETGIKAETIREIGRVTDPGSNAIYVSFYAFTSCEKDSIVLQPGETCDYRWVSAEHISGMKRHELLTERIQLFVRELRSR